MKKQAANVTAFVSLCELLEPINCTSLCLCFSEGTYACVYNRVGRASVSPKRRGNKTQGKKSHHHCYCRINNISCQLVIVFSSRVKTPFSLYLFHYRLSEQIKQNKNILLKATLVCCRTKGERRLIKIHLPL